MSTYAKFKFLTFIIFLLIFTSCNKFKTSKESADYINDPKKEDVYFIEVSSGKFSLMKIANFEEDTIHFNLNKVTLPASAFIDETENAIKHTRVDRLNNQKFWTDSIKSYGRRELIELYNDNIIYEIKRQ